MTVNLEQVPLVAYPKVRDALYYGKVLELRQAVQDWLSYIPQTFPHYTRHTVLHSDNIIVQVSKLLFEDDDPQRPVIQLSAAEALVRVRDCCAQDAHGLTEEQFERLIYLIETPIAHQGHELAGLNMYLDGWRNLPGLPSELYPPAVELTQDMFVMK